MIPFSKPSITEKEKRYVAEALDNEICGDGCFTKRATVLLCERLQDNKHQCLLTTSCSHALDMTALLCNIHEGDEVILPSYTFVSTANAFLLRGAKLVFCEINPKTMNMDTEGLEALITPKTKVIVPVDYAGVPCDMDKVNALARQNNLLVVEDAAQAVGSCYKGKPCGTLGDYGCFSFHETKNYTMGEGGALWVRDDENMKRAEIIREKGTDRSRFIRGEIDKYTWRSQGTSYLPSNILAALLTAQLERFDEIMTNRMEAWNTYHKALEPAERAGKLQRPFIPDYAAHNAHMYYVILPDRRTRDKLLEKLNGDGIGAAFHYLPLHSSPMGQQLGYSPQALPLTEEYAGR
ncbi:MAG: dTDP-4-amino-4,6-dideoxygalactose transaminase, partial [Christensenella sp.]